MALVRARRPNLKLDVPVREEPSDLRRVFLVAPPPEAAAPAAAELRISDFERISVLGSGNGGTVYKVRHRPTGASYALKVPHPDAPAGCLSREIEILRRVDQSSSVVRLLGTIPAASSGHPALLLELMDAGSLDSLLRRAGPLPEPALSSVARQALLGLADLHAHKVAHRDIKPANLLAGRGGDVKVADLGSGRIVRRALESCVSYIGTCAYMSPERFDPAAEGYDGFAGDVWALGLTLLELRLGRFPLLPEGQRPDWAALMCGICLGGGGGGLPTVAGIGDASDEFRGFVGCCLERDAGKRWSVAELLGHPFVAAGDDDACREALCELLNSAA